MTTRTSTSSLLPIFFQILANGLAAYAVVGMIAAASLAHAEPAFTPTANTTAQPPKPVKPEKKGNGTKPRAPAGKTKSAARAGKPAKTPAAPAAKAKAPDKSTASAKPSQVMDFDTDEVAGQRLEPGFELIEGAPAKARHGSLVEPLKPGDSVVRRE